MIVYPIIELQNGRCVSLHSGRIEEPQVWDADPVERAREYARAGAEWLHLTDLDAVDRAETDNRELVLEIIRHAGLPVQVAGGMRTMDRIAGWVDAGAGRVVIGTSAIAQPELVRRAAKAFPDQIVLSVDVHQGKVMSGGWRTPTTFEPADFIAHFARDPLAHIVVTDIDADIAESDASLALITRLASGAPQNLVARGTIRSLDDISRLKYVPRVAGTLIGRALFDGSVNLAEALAVARAPKEATAPFM